jgi:hypothetical protein
MAARSAHFYPVRPVPNVAFINRDATLVPFWRILRPPTVPTLRKVECGHLKAMESKAAATA